jgi:hypothetical protein
LSGIGDSTEAIFSDGTKKSKSEAKSRRGGARLRLIPNIGSFLPEPLGYLAAILTIPGEEENHHGMSIT